jgi:hypothetical protein
MATFEEVLRAVVILLVPITFAASFWFERSEKLRPKGTAKVGASLLALGAALALFEAWIGLRPWKGLFAVLAFEPGTIGYASDVIALAYGFIAFWAFRSIFPKRVTSDG